MVSQVASQTTREGGWTRVMGNHGRRTETTKWNVTGGERGRKKTEEGEFISTITFFITEFGNNLKVEDLFFEFKELSEIDEVVIPPKRDRRERRYDFVRFIKVKDVKLLTIKMDSLVLEGRKLFVNLPRFQRVKKEDVSLKRKGGVAEARFLGAKGGWKQGQGDAAFRNTSGSFSFKNRSFADVLHDRGDIRISSDVENTSNTLHFSFDKEEIYRYRKAFIGIIKNLGADVGLKQLFMEEGIFSIRVTPLCPNLCRLEDLVYGETELFIEERRAWWEQWFSNI